MSGGKDAGVGKTVTATNRGTTEASFRIRARERRARPPKNAEWLDMLRSQGKKGKGKGKGKSKGKDEGKATTSTPASSGLTEAPSVSSGDTVRPDEVGGSTAERKLSENRNLAQALNIDTAQDTAAEHPPWAKIQKNLKKRYERYWVREQRLKYGGDAWTDWGNPNWQAIDPEKAREFKSADEHHQAEHHNQRPPPFDAQNPPLSEYLQKLRRNAETEITHTTTARRWSTCKFRWRIGHRTFVRIRASSS